MGRTQAKSAEAVAKTANRIALGALVVSVFGLLLAGYTFQEQRRQWRATGLGRVDVVGGGFVYWRVVTEAERSEIPWGYDINLMPLMEGRRVSRSYGLPHRLVAVDRQTKKAIPNVAATTMPELIAALKAQGRSLDSLIPAKHYQLEFEFKNVGGTVVSDLRIAIDPQMPDSGAWEAGAESQPIELAPQRSVFKVVDLTGPVEAFLPDRLRFRVNMRYRTVDGEVVTRTESLYYHAPTGSVNFGQ